MIARRLRVAIVSGGDELVDPEQTPGPGQIRDINSYTLAALVSEALPDRPTRLHFVGVPRAVIRDYGTPEQLDRLLGLDAPGIRRQIVSAIG